MTKLTLEMIKKTDEALRLRKFDLTPLKIVMCKDDWDWVKKRLNLTDEDMEKDYVKATKLPIKHDIRTKVKVEISQW